MQRIFIFLGMLSFSINSSPQEPTRESEIFYQRAMTEINPKHAKWVENTANLVNSRNLTEADVKKQATEYAVLGKLNDMDIEALCFLVLMQATKSAQEDLKSIMAQVKKINQEKQKLRDLQSQVDKNKNLTVQQADSFRLVASSIQINQPQQADRVIIKQPVQATKKDSTVKLQRVKMQTASKAEIDNTKETIKNKLDSMTEMGEMQSLQLQTMMERRSKFISTMSNIMKKISDAQNGIIQNLK